MTRQQTAFVILISAFVVITLGYSLVVPLGEAPDEVSHFAYVRYISTHRGLPTLEGAVTGESHQPPLYYLIGALATSWIPQSEFIPIANPDFALDQPQTPNLLLHTRREAFPYRDTWLAWHLLRALSVVMGAGTVWATWRIAAGLVPDNAWIALGTAAFVAFLPGFSFISAMVNNDNLIILLSSASLLQIGRLARQPWHWRGSGTLGVLLGLAAMSKLSGLVVWLFAACAFLYLAWQRGTWRAAIWNALVCFGTAGLIVAPWVVSNLVKHGDPLGWTLVLAATPLRPASLTPNDLVRVIGGGLYTSFWGRFGGALNLRMPDGIYVILGVLPLLALVGWVRRRDLHPKTRIILASFAVFWLIMLAAFARWTLTVLGTDQARQLFLGLPLLALVLILGLAQFSAAHKKIVLSTACGGLLALNLGVLVDLNATFALSSQSAAALPKLGAAAEFDFGHSIRLLDYRVDPVHVAPGGTIAVQTYWQALRDPDEDYWLLLQLAESEQAIASKDGIPAAGNLTTDRWKKDQVFTSRHILRVPSDAKPGIYDLRLGLHPFGKWQWLPVGGQDMASLGIIQVTAGPAGQN